MFLGFYQGTVPCCLGETMVLALEDRAECFSIGRDLDLDKIQEVGALAQGHGFDFTHLVSFGLPIEPSVLVRSRKIVRRRPAPNVDNPAVRNGSGTNGAVRHDRPRGPEAPAARALADRA